MTEHFWRGANMSGFRRHRMSVTFKDFSDFFYILLKKRYIFRALWNNWSSSHILTARFFKNCGNGWYPSLDLEFYQALSYVGMKMYADFIGRQKKDLPSESIFLYRLIQIMNDSFMIPMILLLRISVRSLP